MTERIQQAYHSLSIRTRAGIVLAAVTVLLSISVLIAVAAGGISFTNYTPAAGTVVQTASPKISLYVKDTDNQLSPATLAVKLDNVPLTANFAYPGHNESVFVYVDTCTSYYEDVWVIDSYKEGTVSFNATGLTDGVHNVEVSIADAAGNVLSENWSFNVGSPPTFSSLTPADASRALGVINRVSAVVSDDNNTIDWNTVKLKINNNFVQPEIDQVNKTVYYNGTFPTGSYEAYIEAKDSAGNLGSKTWSFGTDTSASVPSGWSPAKNSIVTTSAPKVSLYVVDTLDNLNGSTLQAKLDGNPVNAVLTLKGHSATAGDSCSGYYTYWAVDSYKEGTISFNTSGLSDGVHNVSISIADARGNVLNESWSFTVGTPVSFTNLTPADGSSHREQVRISAKLNDDNNTVDWNSVVMKVDNGIVAHQTDNATSTVYFDADLPDGTHKIDLEAKDAAGNLGTKTWSYLADSTGPTISNLEWLTSQSGVWGTHGSFVEGLTIHNGQLYFWTDANDNSEVTNIKVLLDGAVVSAGVTYDGFTDSCSGEYIITSRTHARVNYHSVIPDGNHTLAFELGDSLGNTSTVIRNFTVHTEPVFSNITPATYGVKDLTPTISATVKDLNGTVDPASIDLKLNGVKVDHSYDPASGNVSFKVYEPVENEGYQTVTLSAKDNAGLNATTTWQFLTSNYPDMADSSVSNCTTCHSIPHGDFSGYGGGHSDMDYMCGPCHDYMTIEASCGQCHSLDPEWGYQDVNENGHGSFGGPGGWSLTSFEGPVRVAAARETFDCVICHQPGSGIYTTPSPYLVSHYEARTVPLGYHDIPQLHKGSKTSCNPCHAQSLTREHARSGRVDKNGNPVTCNTCHLSTDPVVKNAIAANNLECTACHEGDHAKLHAGNLDNRCFGCHDVNLATEHNTHPKRPNGNDLTCGTCHDSTNNKEKRTIAASSLNCAGCHKQSHDISIVDVVPTDIPLYAGYQWSTPIEASLFNGEVPAGYDSGQVLLSNRRTGVTTGQLWDFYNSELTTTYGWTLKSGAPGAGAASVTAEYTKDTRSVTIKFFNTENRDGTGEQTGYRVELWYK